MAQILAYLGYSRVRLITRCVCTSLVRGFMNTKGYSGTRSTPRQEFWFLSECRRWEITRLMSPNFLVILPKKEIFFCLPAKNNLDYYFFQKLKFVIFLVWIIQFKYDVLMLTLVNFKLAVVPRIKQKPSNLFTFLGLLFNQTNHTNLMRRRHPRRRSGVSTKQIHISQKMLVSSTLELL